MKRIGPSVLLVTTVLGLAGCGSGSSGSGSPPAAGGCPTASTVAGSNSGPEASPPGDIPDDQAFVAYSPAGGRYTVKVPEGWARTEAPGRVTFTDKLNRIDVQVIDAAVAPTVESTRADVVPALAAGESCFSLVGVNSLTRPAGSAVQTLYRADSAPDPVTGKVVYDDIERYSFWKDGTELVLTLAGPAGSDNVDPWRIVTDSLAWRP